MEGKRACVCTCVFVSLCVYLRACVCISSDSLAALRLQHCPSTCVFSGGLWEANRCVCEASTLLRAPHTLLLSLSFPLTLSLSLSLFLSVSVCLCPRKEAVSRRTEWGEEMRDMEVLLVLRLCCNCTYGNDCMIMSRRWIQATWTVFIFPDFFCLSQDVSVVDSVADR